MAEEYLHTPVLIGFDDNQQAITVEAGKTASDLKGFNKKQLDDLRAAGVLRAEKYEEVGPNDTVPQAATLEEREEGADGPRSTSVR
jgi:hypothetical protein